LFSRFICPKGIFKAIDKPNTKLSAINMIYLYFLLH